MSPKGPPDVVGDGPGICGEPWFGDASAVAWFVGLFLGLVLIGLRRAEHGLSSHLLVLVLVLTALLGSFFFSLGR